MSTNQLHNITWYPSALHFLIENMVEAPCFTKLNSTTVLVNVLIIKKLGVTIFIHFLQLKNRHMCIFVHIL